MYIGIDFDGTCVTHEYPRMGRDIGAVPVLKRLIENGHQLILITMRGGNTIDAAINWFEKNEIKLFGININPTQKEWTSSPKAYAELYIDDAGIGCPLIKNDYERPYVDWITVEKILEQNGILK